MPSAVSSNGRERPPGGVRQQRFDLGPPLVEFPLPSVQVGLEAVDLREKIAAQRRRDFQPVGTFRALGLARLNFHGVEGRDAGDCRR